MNRVHVFFIFLLKYLVNFIYTVKMIKKILFIIFLYVLLGISSVKSNAAVIHFKRFSVENGLSQSTVLSLTQDHNGKMWVGTMNGLNWFDGYRFVPFF